MAGRISFLEKGVAQIALVVKNLDETVQKYWQNFGIGPWHFYTYGRPLVQNMSYRGKPADYTMRIALTNIGPLRIELIEPGEGNTIYGEFIENHGYGVHHFGLLVDDMTDALEEAEKAGYRMIQDGSGFGLDGDGHYAYIDTERDLSVTLELIKRPKRRQTPEKVYPPDSETNP